MVPFREPDVSLTKNGFELDKNETNHVADGICYNRDNNPSNPFSKVDNQITS